MPGANGSDVTAAHGETVPSSGRTARRHVEEVIVETLVAGRVGRLALTAPHEEAKRRERHRHGRLAGQVAALDGDGIRGQREAHGRDAGGRSGLRLVPDEAVLGVRLAEEELERLLL